MQLNYPFMMLKTSASRAGAAAQVLCHLAWQQMLICLLLILASKIDALHKGVARPILCN